MYKIFRWLFILSTILRSLNGVSTLSFPHSIIKNEIVELSEGKMLVSHSTVKLIFIITLVLLGGIFAGNLFIYSFLLSNVIVNVAFTIIIDFFFGGGWPAVFISTVLIFLFGEYFNISFIIFNKI